MLSLNHLGKAILGNVVTDLCHYAEETVEGGISGADFTKHGPSICRSVLFSSLITYKVAYLIVLCFLSPVDSVWTSFLLECVFIFH